MREWVFRTGRGAVQCKDCYKAEVGVKYGRLEIISTWKQGNVPWCEVKCECGENAKLRLSFVKNGARKTCGKCIVNQYNRRVNIGDKFNKLTVVATNGKDVRNAIRLLCECECGGLTVTTANHLWSGNTKGCGCLQPLNKYEFGKKITRRLNKKYQGKELSEGYFLGQLCKHGHDWRKTGQSLRKAIKSRDCAMCVIMRSEKARALSGKGGRFKKSPATFNRRYELIKKTQDGTINQREISHLFEKYKSCPYCGKKLENCKVHKDHIVPISKGGPHTISNIVLCCDACNLHKSNKDFDVWVDGLSSYFKKRVERIVRENRQYQLHLFAL